ncbi:hypothetical protein [Amycolatopsis sp. Poz14]|uniref:hypothetical protein n=1 Tax=Amycolatopsis sp. Poz14 TaxID=1447705 RepID=UPI001EE8BCF9|nr:hypothetical protein [Amycolatopsis sp. Poz14]MCG3755827.1 hypothetical protein [Amycolatopsis sp. Poz14]
MITIVSGKGSPGGTTTLAALTAAWPAPVLLADCDPAGGDLAPGWLGQWLVAGAIRADRGVLSHATATRHATAGDPAALLEHVQTVPPARHVGLLAGLTSPGQHSAISTEGWTRLTASLAAFRTRSGRPADALVDVGRFGAATPWPLLVAADLVLLAVRPTPRHVLAARPVLAELAEQIVPERLGLAVCASSPAGAHEVHVALGRAVALELPADERTAAVLSDGTDAGAVPRRSPLLRTARRAARRLHGTYHNYTPAELRVPAPRVSNDVLTGATR